MKKVKLIIAIMLTNIYLNAQISLEQTYVGADDENFGIVMLENSGKKYYLYEDYTYTLKLYNLNHSIYKTITFDITPIVDTNIYVNSEVNNAHYITENLFDLDNEIEFLHSYYMYDSLNNVKRGTLIINENGTIIFSEPNLSALEDYVTLNFPIQNTVNGTKMILHNYNSNTANIYNLPGKLPCTNPCADSLTSGMKIPNPNYRMSNSISAYPNPTKDHIKIDYTLPQGVKKGEIVFYDSQGKEIRRYKVDRTFDHLRISTNDLSAGVYLFNLQTSQGISEGKKLIKIE